MNYTDPKAAPRRTIMWDEASARYIFLDPAAKAVAMAIRANRIAFQAAEPASSTSPIAELWRHSDYDAATRHNARSKASSKRARAAKRGGLQ